jgi:hypothetical protein
LTPRYWLGQGRHFAEEFLVEVGFWSEEEPIVDTRWIDHFVINSKTALANEGIERMDSYRRVATQRCA